MANGERAPFEVDADVNVYAWGVFYLSVCAVDSLDRDEIAERVNRKIPSGVAPWRFSDDPTFRTGEPNPCACQDEPGRTHHLMVC